MQRMTERDQIRSVAERFGQMYALHETWRSPEAIDKWRVNGKLVKDVLTALNCLNAETATVEQVTEIIGAPHWVRPRLCDECGEPSWRTVMLGRPDANFVVCKACLQKAVALLGD